MYILNIYFLFLSINFINIEQIWEKRRQWNTLILWSLCEQQFQAHKMLLIVRSCKCHNGDICINNSLNNRVVLNLLNIIKLYSHWKGIFYFFFFHERNTINQQQGSNPFCAGPEKHFYLPNFASLFFWSQIVINDDIIAPALFFFFSFFFLSCALVDICNVIWFLD